MCTKSVQKRPRYELSIADELEVVRLRENGASFEVCLSCFTLKTMTGFCGVIDDESDSEIK
jgi:hypothetical protein